MKARFISPAQKPDTRTPQEKAAARKRVMSLLGFAAVVGSVSDYSETKKVQGDAKHEP